MTCGYVSFCLQVFRNELLRRMYVHSTGHSWGRGVVFGLRNEEFVMYNSQEA